MALPISPSNGFIARLLQQTAQTPAHSQPSSQHKGGAKADQTSISDAARQAHKNTNNQQLESKLIELYTQKGKGSKA